MLATWKRSIHSVATGGVTVVLGTVAASNILRVVSSVALTHLLSADAFGLVGIITSFTFMITMLSDIGTVPFVVRHPIGDDPRFLDEVWSARLVRGALLSILMVALSGPLAVYAQKSELRPVIAIWGTIFFIDGLSSMAFATALRHGQVRRLSVLDLSASFLQVIISICMAVIIRSYWAIVFSVLIGAVIRAALSYILFPGSSRRIRYSRKRMSELWKFSRYITTSSMLGVAISQGDKVFFARILSLQNFGFYTIATTLATAPMAVVAPFTERILYPAYAKTFREQPEKLAAVYYDTKRYVSLLYMFMVGGFIGSAPLVVGLLYDKRYSPVAPVLQILALAPLLALNNWAADKLLVATGHAWTTVAGNFCRIIWLTLGCGFAYAEGSQYFLICTVGTLEIPPTLFHWVILRRFNLLHVTEELGSLAFAACGCAVGVLGRAAIFHIVGH